MPPTVLFVGARLFVDVAGYAGDAGIRKILTESNPTAPYQELADEVHIVPRGMEHPTRIALERNVDGVVPLIGVDDPLPGVARMKEELERHGIPVAASPPEGTRTGVDKIEAKRAFEDLGIPTPEWEIVDSGRPEMDPPIVVKDPRSQAGHGVSVFTERKPAVHGRRLVERFVDGAEISMEVLSWRGKVVSLVPAFKGSTREDRHPIRRMRMAPAPLNEDVERAIRKDAERLVKKLGLEGNVDFDIVVNGDEYWFLEFNPRPSGTRYLTSGATGIWPLREMTDMVLGDWKPPDPEPKWFAIECPVWRPRTVAPLERLFDGGIHHVFYRYHGVTDLAGRVTVRGEGPEDAMRTLLTALKAAGADIDRVKREYDLRTEEITRYLGERAG